MDDRAFIRGFEGFHNKRFLAITGLAVLAFAAVIASFVAGARRGHLDVAKSSDAVTYPGARPPRAPAAP